jgi:hypothetical protein
VTEHQQAFLALMRSMLPPRDTRRPTLADWLTFRDVAEAWDQVRDGAIRPEPCSP